jgi:hypothetical protein
VQQTQSRDITQSLGLLQMKEGLTLSLQIPLRPLSAAAMLDDLIPGSDGLADGLRLFF